MAVSIAVLCCMLWGKPLVKQSHPMYLKVSPDFAGQETVFLPGSDTIGLTSA